MRRLLYIILICFAAVTTIVARPKPSAALQTVSDEPESVTDTVDSPSDSTIRKTNARNPQRRPYVAPVNNASTRTQYVNDAAGDTARMLERKKQRSIHYHDANGNVVMVDTITGEEWVDSTAIPPPPKMKQPLMFRAEAGVNIWDPVMRVFGQSYGIIDFSAALNLHNRYIPTFEFGLGTAKNTPSDMNFTYTSPIAPYFKLGADYNFIYNSNPDYRFTAGFRYGVSPFSYRLTNVTFDDGYWGESGTIDFPKQNVFAGWMELVAGVRVNIKGPISMGWMFRYKMLLHQTHPSTGDAWYIPGFGSVNGNISGSFSIFYDIPLNTKPHVDADAHRLAH